MQNTPITQKIQQYLPSSLKIFLMYAFLIITALSWQISRVLAVSFQDVPSTNPNFQAIQYLAEKGIIKGYPDGSFQPDRVVSRAEFLKLLMESSNIDTNVDTKTGFTDINENAWYSKYVRKAKNEGWIQGYPDRTFRPEQVISKAEGLKIIAMVQQWNTDKNIVAEKNIPYVDIPSNAWYTPYVVYAKNKNFLEEGRKYFVPNGGFLRGKVSETLFRSIVTSNAKAESYSKNLPQSIDENIVNNEENFIAVSDQNYSSNYFENIVLKEDLPNIFYENEVYTFQGTFKKETAEKAFVFLKDEKTGKFENTIGKIENNTFNIPVIFKKTGNYQLGIIIGEKGKSKVVEISVLASLPKNNSSNKSTPAQNSKIEYKNGFTTFSWSTDPKSISRLLITQGAHQKIYFFRSPETQHAFDVVYSDFKGWEKGNVSFQIETAKTEQTKPLHINSSWSTGTRVNFQATEHTFSEIHDELITVNHLPEIMEHTGTIAFSGITKTDIYQEADITRPDGSVETSILTSIEPLSDYHNSKIIPKGNHYSLSYNAALPGTYIVEINGINGSAVINTPVYVNEGTPFTPDYFDFEDSGNIAIHINGSTAKNQLLNFINEARNQKGLANISDDNDLNLLAQNYADDMSQRDFFGHINPEGKGPNDRRLALKIPTEVGENLARSPNIEYSHYGLMRSPIHRKNLLNPKWERVGIGVAQNANGEIFVVEEFSTYPFTPQKLNEAKANFLEAINKKRKTLNLSPFSKNVTLEDVAQTWSNSMVEQNFFDFIAPDNSTFRNLLQKSSNQNAVEAIILESNSQEKIADELLISANSLNPLFSSIGIGLDVDETGLLKLTAIYSK